MTQRELESTADIMMCEAEAEAAVTLLLAWGAGCVLAPSATCEALAADARLCHQCGCTGEEALAYLRWLDRIDRRTN